jgi:RimJ/RimL family protein N-acetyltransferase
MSDRPIPPAQVDYNQQYVLRPVEPRDVPQVEKALNNSLLDLRLFMHWAHASQNRSQFLERVQTQWNNYFTGAEYEMALFDKKGGEFLVYTGFYPTARLNPNCFEIGYWTSSEHQKKGFATLATQIQIALLFEYFKVDRIEVTSNLENKASNRVIKKCGFHYEGDLRNFYPMGNELMFAAGYTKERRAALFSLIPEDRSSLPWYRDIVQKLTLIPLLDSPFSLADAQGRW